MLSLCVSTYTEKILIKSAYEVPYEDDLTGTRSDNWCRTISCSLRFQAKSLAIHIVLILHYVYSMYLNLYQSDLRF